MRKKTDIDIEDVKHRLFSRIKKNTNGCWEWQGAKATSRGGYGLMGVKSKLWRVHRLSYELMVGSIPDYTDVHHKCANTSCVNPDHLGLLTRSQNVYEARLRGYPLCTKCGQPKPKAQ